MEWHYELVTRCHDAGGYKGIYTYHLIDKRTGEEVDIEEVYSEREKGHALGGIYG